MMTKKFLFLVTLFVFLFQFVKSATWIATSAGYWNSSNTWSTGIVPPTISSDTFIIEYPVALNSDLVFNSGAFIEIDSAGGLCGHYNMTLNSGTTMLTYGILELDILSVAGYATCLDPGQVILTQYGFITGTLSVNCLMIVGTWFDCMQPEYSFILGIEEIKTTTVSFFPNPSDGHFTLSCPLPFQKALFRISDAAGRIVCEKKLSLVDGSEKIDASYLTNGIYYWEMTTDSFSERGKAEILK